MSVRATITSQFAQVASMRGITLAPLADDLPLRESGIDSLSIAVLLMRLEDVFGVYAFNTDVEEFPVTFGDLVHLYERLASGEGRARGTAAMTGVEERAPR